MSIVLDRVIAFKLLVFPYSSTNGWAVNGQRGRNAY